MRTTGGRFWTAAWDRPKPGLGSAEGGEEACAGLFQKGDGLLPGNRGKLLQKSVERLTSFDVIEEVSHRHAGPVKARRATQDLRVHHHDGLLFHVVTLTCF